MKFKVVWGVILAVAVTVPSLGQGVNEGSYEILQNGAGKFKIDIEQGTTLMAGEDLFTVEIDPILLGACENGWSAAPRSGLVARARGAPAGTPRVRAGETGVRDVSAGSR